MSVLRNAIYITIFHFFFISTLAHAEMLPLEVYGKLPDNSMPRMSPSGQLIAYRSKSENKDVILVVNLKNKKLISGMDVSEIDPKNVYFINDEQLVLVASEDIKAFVGSRRVSGSFIFDIHTKEIRKIGATNVVGVSPDGNFLYMADHVQRPGEYTYDVLRVNVKEWQSPRRHKRGRFNVIDYFLDDKGEILARERFDQDDNIHRVEAWVDDEWREIFRQATPYLTNWFVGVSPSRDSLVMIAQNEDGFDAYYTVSLADGSVSGPIFEKTGADIERVLKDINRVVYGVQYSGFMPSYSFFDKELDGLVNAVIDSMPENTFNILDFTNNFEHIIFKVEGEGAAGEYFLYSGGEFLYLTTSRPDITAEYVNPVIRYSYKARDGLSVPSLLTLPKSTAENLPAVMLPHGGPESYNRAGFNWLAQFFASKGFAVIQPQFRGSSGFGSHHTLAGRGQWGKKMQDDLTDAIADLATQGVIDPYRVCIVGISYGGYAALAGATFTPDLYKCAISVNGVSDVELMMSRERRDHGKRSSVVAYWEDSIKNKTSDDDFMANVSPINHVEKVKIPVLLIHGEKDLIVDVEQSENMFEKLKDADKDVTYVELPDENHYLRNNSTRLQALKAIDAFISKHL